jgi:hypothetical protein
VNLKGRNHFGDLDIDGKMILKWLRKNWVVRIVKLDPFDPGSGPVASCCEHGNEALGSIKGESLTSLATSSFSEFSAVRS